MFSISAASALAANSILRSSAGAGFPLFAPAMVCVITPIEMEIKLMCIDSSSHWV